VSPVPAAGPGADLLPSDTPALQQMDLAELGGGTQADRAADTADITAPPERRPAPDLNDVAQHSGTAALEQTTRADLPAAGSVYDAEPGAVPLKEPEGTDDTQTQDVAADSQVEDSAVASEGGDGAEPSTESGRDVVDPPDPPDDGGVLPGDWFGEDPGDSDPLDGLPTRHSLYHRLHPVGRYTAQNQSFARVAAGESVRIPTSLTERTTFTRETEEWVTNRTDNEYRQTLFADDLPDAAPECAHIAGGEQEAMAPGKTVLDVASGEAIALLRFAEDHPGTKFIGVDAGYKEVRTIDPDKPGVQLTHDDWHTLGQIPDNSVDTILSSRGVIPWGMSPDSPRSQEVADALTRVAKPGAVWRFDTYDAETHNYVAGLMVNRGWEVRDVITADGFKSPTGIAIKRR
jgi:hypothetical protein